MKRRRTKSATVPPGIAAELARLIEKAITRWSLFDSDESVSGSEIVEWFANWRRQAQLLLTSSPANGEAQPPKQSDPLKCLHESLHSGLITTPGSIPTAVFIVLTRDGCKPRHKIGFEAWAYAIPGSGSRSGSHSGGLDFDDAQPIRFGTGLTIIQALEALDHHLRSMKPSI